MDFPFLKGISIGFSIAAPVGPIGVLCVRRSLAQGARVGLFTGLGAAVADGIYGAVAAFGLTLISNFLREYQMPLRMFGGAFLIYLGFKTIFSKPTTEIGSSGNHAGAFASTLLLTLTNPMTIFSFMAIFAGVGLGGEQTDYWTASKMTGGVFLGSAAWWLFLSNVVALLRDRITPQWMQQVNRLSGAIIIAFAVWILLRVRR